MEHKLFKNKTTKNKYKVLKNPDACVQLQLLVQLRATAHWNTRPSFLEASLECWFRCDALNSVQSDCNFMWNWRKLTYKHFGKLFHGTRNFIIQLPYSTQNSNWLLIHSDMNVARFQLRIPYRDDKLREWERELDSMSMKKKVSIKMQDDFKKLLDNMFAGLWLSIHSL